jgi:hypothetical protein
MCLHLGNAFILINEFSDILPIEISYFLCSRELAIAIIVLPNKLHPWNVELVEEFMQRFH